MEKYYRCHKCGCEMFNDEVWVSDNTKDEWVYCFTHAPDSAIRFKDTIKAQTTH